MIIGITINNILRDHVSQLIKIYTLTTEEDPIYPINPFDLEASFPKKESSEAVLDWQPDTTIDIPFNDIGTEAFDVFNLMYVDASFEVFGRSEEAQSGILMKLKKIEKSNKINLVLLNKESPRSKCATLFFLSKNNFDFSTIHFPKNNKEFWKHVDVLLTDDPKILNSKPKNKISIKFQNEFNIDIKSDYTIFNIKQLNKVIKNIKKLQNGEN